MIVRTVAYGRALEIQREAAALLRDGCGGEALLLLAHPPTVTLGRKGSEGSLLVPPARLGERGIVFLRVERGGDATYHGPGQLVGYPVFDLEARRLGPRRHVALLEQVLSAALKRFGIEPVLVDGVRGVFVAGCGGKEPALGKIAAIGIAVSRGISTHGFALNVRVDPAGFDLIIPCGLRGYGVTSMHLLLDPAPCVEEVADVLDAGMREAYGNSFETRNRFP